MYASDNKRSIALNLKRFRTLYYSLYHNYIKQLLQNAFILIVCFQHQKINYYQFKKNNNY